MATDEELFAEAMGKVKPMAGDGKVKSSAPSARKTVAAVKERQRKSGPVLPARAGQSVKATDDPWSFVADGVSRERLKRLAAGKPPAGITFDLHGATRDEALAMLERGFEQAMTESLRALCIIHGRGLHSQGKPVLKEAVYHWLRHGAFSHRVLAVIPQPGSGGGAALVLLRRKQA